MLCCVSSTSHILLNGNSLKDDARVALFHCFQSQEKPTFFCLYHRWKCNPRPMLSSLSFSVSSVFSDPCYPLDSVSPVSESIHLSLQAFLFVLDPVRCLPLQLGEGAEGGEGTDPLLHKSFQSHFLEGSLPRQLFCTSLGGGPMPAEPQLPSFGGPAPCLGLRIFGIYCIFIGFWHLRLGVSF